MTDHILTTRQDHILHIQFNRPDKKNALTLAMYTAVSAALEQAATDSSVRVILFSGSGDSFTAGNDIADFMQNPPLSEDSPVFRFLRVLTTAAKPIVAAVHGAAVGVGTTMLLHCDLVYLGASARLQTPFTRLALVPEAASSYLLPRLMGHPRAAELLLLGDPVPAQKAYEMGLATAVVPDDALAQTAHAKALQLASLPPQAVRTAKALMKRATAAVVAETMQVEGREFAAHLQSPEAAEAFQAFMQRRPPDFSQFS